MAKAFSKILGENFLFIISHAYDAKSLSGINYRETDFGLFRKWHLTAFYYILWMPFFLNTVRNENVTLYFKDEILASIAIFLRRVLRFKYRVFCEYHHPLNNWREGYVLKNADLILPITRSLKKIISAKFGIAEQKILVAPDGVDINIFDIPDQSTLYRKKLNLPSDKKIIGYVGTFSTMGYDKGVRDLIAAFVELKQKNKDIFLLLAGGKNEADAYEKFAQEKGLARRSDFIIERYVDYSLVPEYLKSCDVLISPFPFTQHFAYYMSPLKIFEYMASLRPIITSDLPSIREVLTENEAIFFKPGDVADLSEKISLVLKQPEAYRSMAEAAFEKAKNYTWEARAKHILEFIR